MAIPFTFPGLRRVRCLFSTVRAGDMMRYGTNEGDYQAGLENRQRFMTAAGFSVWADIYQVHGDAITEARGHPLTEDADLPRADGHYTFAAGLGLIVRTADCQPLLLARRDGGAVAALHVGWRGNAMNFPGTAVARLCAAFACDPGDLLAVRGPSLGPTAAEFVNFASEWPPEFLPWFAPTDKTVNLWALTRYQLEQAGLRPDCIFGVDMCTHTMREHFFSHRRRDGGRMANVIWLE